MVSFNKNTSDLKKLIGLKLYLNIFQSIVHEVKFSNTEPVLNGS